MLRCIRADPLPLSWEQPERCKTPKEMQLMKFLKGILGAAALASLAALVPNSSAQTLQVLTAGSSAQFGPFAAAAYNLAAAGGATEYHYTVKSGSCASGSTTCYASV